MSAHSQPPDPWPALPYSEIQPTVDHLHRLSQIGGKYTLDQPFEPHWGHVVLLVSPRGFATPTLRSGEVLFTVAYELLDDRVTVSASTGQVSLPLGPGSVAQFYERFLDSVAPLGIGPLRTSIEPEIADAPTLETDREERPFDAQVARRIWSALASAAGALTVWQAPFRGHRPPVGLMWGGFDLSATRYNGRPATPSSTMPIFQQNAMDEEDVAVGFWLGDERSRQAAFYAYISPEPEGIDAVDFEVAGAAYDPNAGLVVLPWDAVRATDDPQATVVRFADAVYEAAVGLGGWPANLVAERHDGWYASTHRVFAR